MPFLLLQVYYLFMDMEGYSFDPKWNVLRIKARECRHFPVERPRNKRLLFMVTNVVSTRFVDVERRLESYKITTVTLSEIRGPGSRIFLSFCDPGQMFAPDLGQPILILNRIYSY